MSDKVNNETVLGLAAALQEHMKLTEDSKGVDWTDSDNGPAFKATLPESLTMEQFNASMDHVKNLAPAMVLATAKVAEPAIIDKKTDAVTASLKMGNHGNIHVNHSRMVTRPRSVTDRTPVDVYGATSVKIDMHARKPSGQMKIAMDTVRANAANLYKDD